MTQPPDQATADNLAPSASPKLHRSRVIRALLWLFGTIALLLGIAGIFLPVLPTTPFVLLAAACYARASERFHQRLLKHPTFGPTIRNWEENRCLAPRTKRVAIAMMTLSIAVSIYVVRSHLWLQLMLATIALSVGLWMWRLPEHAESGTAGELNTPSTPADASP